MALTTPGLNHLFVYGTLRAGHRHAMYDLLVRNAAFLGKGTIQGRLYNLGEYPGIVLSQTASELVQGETYTLLPENQEETLKLLDDYEGIGSSYPLPHEYKRALVAVTLSSGAKVQAWAYILNIETDGLERIISGDYIDWRRSGGT